MKLLGTAWSSFSNDACRVMSALLLEMLDKLWNSATLPDKLSLINAGYHGIKSEIEKQSYRKSNWSIYPYWHKFTIFTKYAVT